MRGELEAGAGEEALGRVSDAAHHPPSEVTASRGVDIAGILGNAASVSPPNLTVHTGTRLARDQHGARLVGYSRDQPAHLFEVAAGSGQYRLRRIFQAHDLHDVAPPDV